MIIHSSLYKHAAYIMLHHLHFYIMEQCSHLRQAPDATFHLAHLHKPAHVFHRLAVPTTALLPLTVGARLSYGRVPPPPVDDVPIGRGMYTEVPRTGGEF